MPKGLGISRNRGREVRSREWKLCRKEEKELLYQGSEYAQQWELWLCEFSEYEDQRRRERKYQYPKHLPICKGVAVQPKQFQIKVNVQQQVQTVCESMQACVSFNLDHGLPWEGSGSLSQIPGPVALELDPYLSSLFVNKYIHYSCSFHSVTSSEQLKIMLKTH